ncbi:HAD family hydrolase [Tychonema sp. LEGE 07203]|uniref:HAD family hydrolase n=1 Tax=Tychonema sp. LEGE 07203 TaxID=1828671 RepID=UPI00187FCAF3|nr:HAD family hydrolase [Tychonema sp. LEGE 07203]MBE9095806.1 HAD family hydrolase [Tychonema sp. LEGE 07203]
MLRLITDFDGPIMDVSDRYYRVYLHCLAETQREDQPVRELALADFWDMKRARVPETEIGILSGLDAAQALEFAQKRRQIVHTLPYLIYDRPAQGAVETLEKVQRAGVDLTVMTMRRVRELDEAFTRCNLGQFFPENRRYCLPNDYVKTGDVKDKPLLMARALAELPPASEVWMVGDTEADMIAAKTHGVKVIGVLCGIRDRAQLEMHQPDLIANNLSAAVEMILGSC